jgi:hypothetical protein
MAETLTVPREIVQRLRARLPAVTREHLFDCYAISETTWTKLRDGKPIKRSTLERILQRYERLRPRGVMPDRHQRVPERHWRAPAKGS